MTDAEAAEVLQDLKAAVHDMPERLAAIERAIELLSLDWDMIPVEREELRRLVMERRNKP